MSDGNRRIDNSAIALAVVLLLGIFSIIGYYLGQDEGRSRAAQISAQKHHEDTAAQIEKTCAGLSQIAMTECIEKAVETSGDHQRAEYDLAAQQDVAEWTKWVLIVSVIGVLLTVIGIYFVWLTFGETRQTNIIAREMGQAQVRAYLTIEDVDFVKSEEGWEVKFNIVNVGQSPGYLKKIVLKLSQTDNTGSIYGGGDIEIGLNWVNLPIGNIPKPVTFIFPIDQPMSDDRFWGRKTFIEIRVSYQDVFKRPDEFVIYAKRDAGIDGTVDDCDDQDFDDEENMNFPKWRYPDR